MAASNMEESNSAAPEPEAQSGPQSERQKSAEDVAGWGEPGERKRRSYRAYRTHRPLRLRTWLVVLTVLVSAFGLFASSFAVYSVMREVFYQRVDDDLTQSMDGWAQNSELFSGNLSASPPTDYAVIHIFPDGSSRVYNDRDTLPQINNLVIGGGPRSVPSIDGPQQPEWRAIAAQKDGVVTIVAKNLERENGLLRGLAMLQALISLLMLGFLALLSFAVIRQTLKPLQIVQRTASDIAEGDLDRRVPNWPLNTEVGQLSAALNIMLERLQDSIESAQSKEEQMRRFVGDASHELRTPLTSLRGYVELYRSGATDDVDHVFATIDDESARMKLLVEDLLALTRAEGSRLDKRTVDVLELSLAVVGSARAAFPERTIDVDNKTTDIPVVSGDPDRLHQVLLNLITNGLNHGGPDASVTLTLRKETRADSADGADSANGAGAARKSDYVCIDVSDDGRGMSEEVAGLIFERFYREDPSRARGAGGGSGLGLAIVKSLVDQHDGEITVDSTPGEGSTFTVCIPALEQPGLSTETYEEYDADAYSDEFTEEYADERPKGHEAEGDYDAGPKGPGDKN
ncbi:HAMP domain-containing sensor histidine kinase [Corynebacterium propinquum]|nr:HAMP domain-containing sensor histidine kinase [Corynebacterium propinquum]MDK4238487.1 HAMP domain-containing sensor histidine kinase [Corynebacterium propinquum]